MVLVRETHHLFIVPTPERGNEPCTAPAVRDAERPWRHSHARAWERCNVALHTGYLLLPLPEGEGMTYWCTDDMESTVNPCTISCHPHNNQRNQ
jgi:hypothetical protein